MLLLLAAIYRRHKKQRAINKELTAHIDELREKYKQVTLQLEQAQVQEAETDKEKKEELSAADREFLEKTINVVSTMIHNGQVDAEGAAREMGMSLYQFRQRLTNVTGEKPQDFINAIRMKRAQHLLTNHPELNITEVAVLCAYNDTPNFTRAFKKYFGVTPKQYQKEA